ncbi:hypothetical protein LOTGIDRAFT_176530 [Lottia gigantea]|uniref:Uncharacterized protein n=1 Tax=Lottia gigantea TaxID=225164 RepID=V4AQT4_LOTGI|nr:hypothetical protein LOTGIDRAFT_176530 [Lottia gigantea]ESO97190.1 hypothetical protein LOTGIDRAFT_176530 [Lottia gigantea]
MDVKVTKEKLGAAVVKAKERQRKRREEEAKKRREERSVMFKKMEEIEVLEEDVGEEVKGRRERRRDEDWAVGYGRDREEIPERVKERRARIKGLVEFRVAEREEEEEEEDTYCCVYGCVIV